MNWWHFLMTSNDSPDSRLKNLTEIALFMRIPFQTLKSQRFSLRASRLRTSPIHWPALRAQRATFVWRPVGSSTPRRSTARPSTQPQAYFPSGCQPPPRAL